LIIYHSFGSGEEDGEESFDDSDARRKLEEYQGSTAAAASANRDRGNNRDGPSDSDDNGAPQDEQRQAVEAAAEAAAAAGISGYLQNGQVSRINNWCFLNLSTLYQVDRFWGKSQESVRTSVY